MPAFRFAISKADFLIPSGASHHLPFVKKGRHEVGAPPPLTIRGGIFYYGSLVQRELSAKLTEGLSD